MPIAAGACTCACARLSMLVWLYVRLYVPINMSTFVCVYMRLSM